MDMYIDIQILPDPDFEATVVMCAVFAKLHRALVMIDTNQIGVSFPEFTHRPSSLGTVLRLHGTRDEFDRLLATTWLTGVRDHIALHGPADVPEGVSYRTVRRVQPKGSPTRLARRYAKRHGVSKAEALQRYAGLETDQLRRPYIRMRSASTGESFSLFFEHGPLDSTPKEGSFSAYGLSDSATIPWF